MFPEIGNQAHRIMASLSGGTEIIMVHNNNGATGYEAHRMLQAYGVKTYGCQVLEKNKEVIAYGAIVGKNQVVYAEYLLSCYGQLIYGPYRRESHAQIYNEVIRTGRRRMPVRWGKDGAKSTFSMSVFRGMANMFGVPFDDSDLPVRKQKTPRGNGLTGKLVKLIKDL